MGEGNPALAIGLTKRALKYGDNWNFRYMLADLYFRTGEYGKALQEADKAITLRPNMKESRQLKSRILAAVNQA